MKLIIPLSLIITLTACGTAPMRTPQELAIYSRCDIDNISHWIGQSIEYREQQGWNVAENCMLRGYGDCKCAATVARDTMLACGYEAKIVILRGNGKTHAVALFTDNRTGRRGFIDGIYRRTYSPGTPWPEVINGIGGKWMAVE